MSHPPPPVRRSTVTFGDLVPVSPIGLFYVMVVTDLSDVSNFFFPRYTLPCIVW